MHDWLSKFVRITIKNSCPVSNEYGVTWWTNTSSLVSFLLMNPYPDLTLNHFTVPLTYETWISSYSPNLSISKDSRYLRIEIRVHVWWARLGQFVEVYLGGDHLLCRLLLLFHLINRHFRRNIHHSSIPWLIMINTPCHHLTNDYVCLKVVKTFYSKCHQFYLINDHLQPTILRS